MKQDDVKKFRYLKIKNNEKKSWMLDNGQYDMFNMHDTQKVTLLRIDAESSVVVTLWEEFEFGCPEG